MAIIKHRPITPTQRFYTQNKCEELDKKRPERSLTVSKHRAKGRNCYGRITSRRRGGGHKRKYRIIDFARRKLDVEATVKSLEYDPNRSANIALIEYTDGEIAYILAPNKLAVGDKIISSNGQIEYNIGNAMPLKNIPPSTKIHSIELHAGCGAVFVRSAGVAAQLVNVEKGKATVRMPSKELRLIDENCRATIGEVGNSQHQNATIGKAGRNRWKGRRPRVRGVAMNPVDHPMGGGEGRTSGGGHPTSPWGQLSKGYPTRKRSKPSNSMILVRRNGKKFKR